MTAAQSAPVAAARRWPRRVAGTGVALVPDAGVAVGFVRAAGVRRGFATAAAAPTAAAAAGRAAGRSGVSSLRPDSPAIAIAAAGADWTAAGALVGARSDVPAAAAAAVAAAGRARSDWARAARS